MNLRNLVLTLLACTLSAVVAVTLLEHLSTWLLEASGDEGRKVIALASAPWFGPARTVASATLPPTLQIRGQSVGRPAQP